MSGITYRMRYALIESGKLLPFMIGLLVLISYSESLYALITYDYIATDDAVILNKPISWAIAEYFRYNTVTLCIMFIMSIAIQACIWNKTAILYLGAQLAEKSYFATIELDEEIVYLVVIINILICVFFCYKGIRILIRK